jgi:hypothetical protein
VCPVETDAFRATRPIRSTVYPTRRPCPSPLPGVTRWPDGQMLPPDKQALPIEWDELGLAHFYFTTTGSRRARHADAGMGGKRHPWWSFGWACMCSVSWVSKYSTAAQVQYSSAQTWRRQSQQHSIWTCLWPRWPNEAPTTHCTCLARSVRPPVSDRVHTVQASVHRLAAQLQ